MSLTWLLPQRKVSLLWNRLRKRQPGTHNRTNPLRRRQSRKRPRLLQKIQCKKVRKRTLLRQVVSQGKRFPRLKMTLTKNQVFPKRNRKNLRQWLQKSKKRSRNFLMTKPKKTLGINNPLSNKRKWSRGIKESSQILFFPMTKTTIRISSMGRAQSDRTFRTHRTYKTRSSESITR